MLPNMGPFLYGEENDKPGVMKTREKSMDQHNNGSRLSLENLTFCFLLAMSGLILCLQREYIMGELKNATSSGYGHSGTKFGMEEKNMRDAFGIEYYPPKFFGQSDYFI
jgi:hypothetical protein